MTEITSEKNPRIRNLLRLKTSRGRKLQGRIVIYGAREAQRFRATGGELLEVYWLEGCDKNPELVSSHSQEFVVSADIFRKIQFGEREDSVVSVAERPDTSLEHFAATGRAPILILDGLEKPGNIGAVFRTADGAGTSGILLTNVMCDVFHPNSIRSSMGTVFSIPAATTDVDQAIRWLQDDGRQVIAARVDGASDFFEMHLDRPLAIAVGNEATGLGTQWNHPFVQSARLPMRGIADSLNVSASAASCSMKPRDSMQPPQQHVRRSKPEARPAAVW